MLLLDLMHKVEIGGWKALLIHLLQMLQSVNDQLLVELCRQMVRDGILINCSQHAFTP